MKREKKTFKYKGCEIFRQNMLPVTVEICAHWWRLPMIQNAAHSFTNKRKYYRLYAGPQNGIVAMTFWGIKQNYKFAK